MKMREITGQRVKLSAGTITIKDECGKTRGLVRDVRRFDRWTNGEHFQYHQALAKSGIWGSCIEGLTSRVYLDGKNLYFLNDQRPIEEYNRLKNVLEGSPIYNNDVKRHNERLAIAERAREFMTVIDCYILG